MQSASFPPETRSIATLSYHGMLVDEFAQAIQRTRLIGFYFAIRENNIVQVGMDGRIQCTLFSKVLDRAFEEVAQLRPVECIVFADSHVKFLFDVCSFGEQPLHLRLDNSHLVWVIRIVGLRDM